MKFRGLELPTYDTSDVCMEHNGALADFISNSTANTVVRHVSLDTEYVHPTKGLLGVLKLVDRHWEQIDNAAPDQLSVVNYSWGLAPKPSGYSHNDNSMNAELMPEGYVLVAEVDVIRPVLGLTVTGENKIEDIFTQYFNKNKSGKPYLYDLHPAQCVRQQRGGTAVLVDIEPRLMIR